MRFSPHLWRFVLALLPLISIAIFTTTVSPLRGDGSLNRVAVVAVMLLAGLSAFWGTRFLTLFFLSPRRATWLAIFSGFLVLQLMSMSSLGIIKGPLSLGLLIVFNIILFWYMIYLVSY